MVNVMPTFLKFWDATLQSSETERVQAFFATVVAGYPDLFHHGLIASGALTGLQTVPDAQRRVAAYLKDVDPLIPGMRRIANSIQNSVPDYIDEFAATFPDFAQSTPIYFTVSLFGLAAGLRIDRADTGLYFGIDELARTLDTESAFKVVFDHELFHAYHHQINPEVTDNTAAWAYMWEEGLATFVSQRMNPGTSADQVLVTPARLSQLANPVLPSLARQMLDIADSTDPSAYGDLFSAEKGRAGMPLRAGYYVGYKVAEKLEPHRTLQQLAHLHGPDLRGAVRTALASMASGAEKHG